MEIEGGGMGLVVGREVGSSHGKRSRYGCWSEGSKAIQDGVKLVVQSALGEAVHRFL